MQSRDIAEATALWRLVRTLGWLDIKLRYRGSVLGPFWLTISTATMVAAMGVVYSTLFHQDMHEYLPFLALSLVLWGFVSGTVSDACTCFSASGEHDPFDAAAIRGPCRARRRAQRADARPQRAGDRGRVFVLLDLAGHGRRCAAIPAFMLWVLDAVAACLLFGCFCARFRDIPPIVASVMQIAFFVSPIVWEPIADRQSRALC